MLRREGATGLLVPRGKVLSQAFIVAPGCCLCWEFRVKVRTPEPLPLRLSLLRISASFEMSNGSSACVPNCRMAGRSIVINTAWAFTNRENISCRKGMFVFHQHVDVQFLCLTTISSHFVPNREYRMFGLKRVFDTTTCFLALRKWWAVVSIAGTGNSGLRPRFRTPAPLSRHGWVDGGRHFRAQEVCPPRRNTGRWRSR